MEDYPIHLVIQQLCPSVNSRDTLFAEEQIMLDYINGKYYLKRESSYAVISFLSLIVVFLATLLVYFSIPLG